MILKTEWLEVIHKLSELGSISAVADELGYTQQALSYTLGLCEQYFNCSLFIRQSRQLILTPEGQKVLAITRKYHKQMDTLQNSMLEFQAQGLPRKWRLARSTSFTSANQLGLLLGEITHQFSDYTLAIEWIAQHQLETAVLRENIPLALSFYPAKSPLLNSYKLFESPYVWVVRSDQAGIDSIPVIEFKYHYLNRARHIYSEGSDYTYLSEFLTPERLPSIATGNMLEILQLLHAGCGKACVPLIDVEQAIESGQITLLETTQEKVTGYLIVAEKLLPKAFKNWLNLRF
jgi:DNA-binding transcriptional LysR family regulator